MWSHSSIPLCCTPLLQALRVSIIHLYRRIMDDGARGNRDKYSGRPLPQLTPLPLYWLSNCYLQNWEIALLHLPIPSLFIQQANILSFFSTFPVRLSRFVRKSVQRLIENTVSRMIIDTNQHSQHACSSSFGKY